MPAYTYEMVRENSRIPAHFDYVHSPECTIPAHCHEYMEILMIISGHLTAVIQAKTYELSSGDILIINSNDIHMTQTSASKTDYILLQISARSLQQFFPNFASLHFVTWIPRNAASACSDAAESLASVSPPSDSIALHDRTVSVHLSPAFYLLEMLDIYEKKEDGYPLLFTARLHDLLYCLYKNYSYWLTPDSQKAAHRDILRIIQTMDWVGEHYREPLTLDDAAGNLGLSREYFCRIFKKYTGQTFLEYVNDIRVMRFHDELLYSDDSITNLMSSHGISNYKIFLRTFKKLYRETPQKMRKQLSAD